MTRYAKGCRYVFCKNYYNKDHSASWAHTCISCVIKILWQKLARKQSIMDAGSKVDVNEDQYNRAVAMYGVPQSTLTGVMTPEQWEINRRRDGEEIRRLLKNLGERNDTINRLTQKIEQFEMLSTTHLENYDDRFKAIGDEL